MCLLSHRCGSDALGGEKMSNMGALRNILHYVNSLEVLVWELTGEEPEGKCEVTKNFYKLQQLVMKE